MQSFWAPARASTRGRRRGRLRDVGSVAIVHCHCGATAVPWFFTAHGVTAGGPRRVARCARVAASYAHVRARSRLAPRRTLDTRGAGGDPTPLAVASTRVGAARLRPSSQPLQTPRPPRGPRCGRCSGGHAGVVAASGGGGRPAAHIPAAVGRGGGGWMTSPGHDRVGSDPRGPRRSLSWWRRACGAPWLGPKPPGSPWRRHQLGATKVRGCLGPVRVDPG